MAKVLLIDVAAQEVREVQSSGLADLQKMIGGDIELAHVWESKDVCFVDEHGTFKPQKHFFRLAPRGEYPFAGNGVIVGPEIYDDGGEFLGDADVTLTVAEVVAQVTFLSRVQADAWGKANASEPAITFMSIGEDGQIEEEVIGRMGSLFADMPKPEDEDGDSK
jgi:hypothetical protein